MRRARDLRIAQDEQAARTQAESLTGVTITIAARAAANGRLFGSVAAAEIADALKAQTSVEVDRDSIVLSEPIKSVGLVEVPIRLFGDLSVQRLGRGDGRRLTPARSASVARAVTPMVHRGDW